MRPTLLLHGALGSADTLAPLAAALGDHPDVIRVEFPGHGRTPLGDTAFSIAGFTAATDRLVRELPAPPLVFGYSMGGYVALALEAARPGALAGILTLGTKYAWTPTVAAADAARLDPTLITTKVPRFAAALAQRHPAEGWERCVARTAGLVRDLGDHPVLDSPRLSRVRALLRCAVGATDDQVSVTETRALAADAGGEALVLEGLGHPLERVPPGTIASLLRSLDDAIDAAAAQDHA
jgi:pimeloyl-ACP methyl ester carboxylesterase